MNPISAALPIAVDHSGVESIDSLTSAARDRYSSAGTGHCVHDVKNDATNNFKNGFNMSSQSSNLLNKSFQN